MEEDLEKKASLRKKCLDELLASEDSYLNHLTLLQKYFIEPILEKLLLPLNLYGSIFGNISAIHSINVRLYEELRRHHATDTIGQAFIAIAPYLKSYAVYAKTFDQAQSSLKNFQIKDKKFRKFIESQECHPELNGLKLNSLLITPIQRVPRYKLLIHEIINYTPKDHPDYSHLLNAEIAMENVANHINTHISQTSEIQAMLSIQKALTYNRPQIFKPGRLLIKQGFVKKLSRRGNGEQKRFLILFTDIIMYCKCKHSQISKPDSLECCCVMPLGNCSVEPVFGIMFKLICEEEEILFYCNSACECNIWIESIRDAASTLCTNKQSLKKDVSFQGPLKRKALLRQRIDSLSVIVRERAKKRARYLENNNCDKENQMSNENCNQDEISENQEIENDECKIKNGSNYSRENTNVIVNSSPTNDPINVAKDKFDLWSCLIM